MLCTPFTTAVGRHVMVLSTRMIRSIIPRRTGGLPTEGHPERQFIIILRANNLQA
jgi:hypothetical protein